METPKAESETHYVGWFGKEEKLPGKGEKLGLCLETPNAGQLGR